MRKSILTVWAALVLLLVGGCSAGEWETFRLNGEEGYIVAVPAGAEGSENGDLQLSSRQGDISLEAQTFRADDASFTVAHGSLEEEAESAEEIDAFLDEGQRWLVEQAGYRPRELERSALSWNGYPGREVRFRMGGEGIDGRGKAYILLVEDELYFVIAAGPEEIMDERADRFLASFSVADD